MTRMCFGEPRRERGRFGYAPRFGDYSARLIIELFGNDYGTARPAKEYAGGENVLLPQASCTGSSTVRQDEPVSEIEADGDFGEVGSRALPCSPRLTPFHSTHGGLKGRYKLSEADPERAAEASQLDHVDPKFPAFAFAHKRRRLADSLGDLNLAEACAVPRPLKQLMRTLIVDSSALILTGVILAILAGRAHAQPAHRLVTQAEYDRWQTELSNWGRWGKDDELGTLNLITPAKRRQALALAKETFSVSLARDASTTKELDNPCPIEWELTTDAPGTATDRIAYPCIHGPGTTHLDSFAHMFFDGKMWNGYPRNLVTKQGGAAKNSILTMKNGIVTRGVLYDIPKLKGVPYLEPGTRIFAEDLEAWEKKAGVKVTAGDALILRWGKWARRAKVGPQAGDEAAGLDNSVIPWLKKRDIGLLVWETSGYVPQPLNDLSRNALHNFVLEILGVHILDRADLEALSEATASRKRWEFMLMVAPLPIPNGTGSPVNPIAMF